MAQIPDATRELAELRERLLELEHELADLPDLRAAAAERDYLVAELARAETDAEAHIAHLRAHIAALEGSVSWQVTKPLRALKRLRA